MAQADEILDGLHPGVGLLEVIDDAGHFPWPDPPDRLFEMVGDFVVAQTR